ncbi:MAG: DUF1761 domain-containing protein [Patescibacteria group bacterium]
MDITINYLAVVVSAIAAMVVGYLWYGPLFGRQWRHLMGVTKESMSQKFMTQTYTIMFISVLVMAGVLAHNLVFGSAFLNLSGVTAGIQVGFWNWLGFVVPVSLGTVLWERKPWKLWFINAGYYLVVMVKMGIILALWQ